METPLKRVAGCNGKADQLIITHDLGRSTYKWKDISHAFAVKIKNLDREEVPMLLFYVDGEDGLYYINGYKITIRLFSFDVSEIKDKKAFTSPKTLDLREKNFRWVAEEICAAITRAYIDKPLVEFIRGSMFLLPTFNSLREAAVYCETIKTTITPGEATEIPDLSISDEELKKITAPLTERKEWKEGTVIEGKYTVQEIMRGGMGIVYVVFDPENVKFYAVKTFQERYLWDEKVIKQFIKEAEIWINLEKHKNIVKAERVKVIEGKPYIFLEYIKGTELEDLMKFELLPVKKSIELSIQFCDGMNYAFNKLGLIHRDIKPANCLITKDWVLKITDFGLGKIFDEQPAEGDLVPIIQKKTKGKKITSSSAALVGTLPFMAPELFESIKNSGVKTDIYSFGIVLYMMLTGLNPFHHEDASEVIVKHLTHNPDPPSYLNSEVPSELSSLVMKCIEKHPIRRYENFGQIKAELEKMYLENFGMEYRVEEEDEMLLEEDWLNKGYSLASIERHREAVITFGEALRINPQSIPALINKGISHSKIGEENEALDLFNLVKQMAPENWEVWLCEGEALARSGKYDEALRSLDHALTLAPDTPEVLASKGKLLAETGKEQEALSCFNLALEQKPNMEEVWIEKGKALYSFYNFDDASVCFQKAIEINPRNKDGWYYRGITFYRLGFYEEAISAHQKAITLTTDSVRDRIGLANCFRVMGSPRDALLSLDQALQIRGDSMEIYLSKARLFEDIGLTEDAQRLIRKAMKYAPEDNTALLEIARWHLKMGNYEQTLNLCTKLKKSNYEDWQLNLLYNSASSWIEARKNILSFIRGTTPPDHELIYKDLSSLLCTFCNITEAGKHLETAVRLKEDANKYFLLAQLQVIMGHFGDAIFAAEKAAALDRTFADSKNIIQNIIREIESIEEKHKRKKGIFASILKREGKVELKLHNSLIIGLKKVYDGEYAEATNYLQEAMNADPSLHVCLFFAGYALWNIADYEKAEYLLNSFVKNCPDSPGFYRYRILTAPAHTDQKHMDNLNQKWIALAPQDPESWISFLRYLTETKRETSAYLYTQELIKKYVNNWSLSKNSSQYWNLRGILQLIVGPPNKAAKYFRKSLRLEPKNPLAILGTGKCYELLDIEVEAISAYEKLLAAESTSLMGAYQLTNLNLRKKKSKEAHYTIDMALKIKPDSLVLKYKKAQIYAEFDDFQNFFDYYTANYQQENYFYPFCLLRAKSLISTDRLNEALSFVEGALQTDPGNIPFLKTMGLIYIRANEPEKAIECYRNVLKLDSYNVSGYMGIGISLYMLSNYSQAITFFEKYLNFDPFNPHLWLYLGATWFWLRKFENAQAYFKRAVDYHHSSSSSWTNFGIFSYWRKKYKEALNFVDRALRTDKMNVAAWLCRGKTLKEMGNLQDSYRSFDQALQADPDNLYAWLQRGILEYLTNNPKQAFVSFSRACQIDDRKAGLWYNRAIAALLFGEMNEVKKSLARTSTLDSHMLLPWLARAVLHRKENDQESFNSAILNAETIDALKFRDWYAKFNAASIPERTLPLYDGVPLPFDLPLPFTVEFAEPVHPTNYSAMDSNF